MRIGVTKWRHAFAPAAVNYGDVPRRAGGIIFVTLLPLAMPAQSWAADAAVVPVQQSTAAGETSSPRVWISPGIYSEHFDRSKNLRNDNPGLTVEVDVTQNSALVAGSYINSNRARTHYAAYAWQPLQGNLPGLPDIKWKAGALIGAFDGYPNYHSGGWFVAPLPVVSLETRYVGLNMSLIPTIRDRLDGALSLQFKLRLW